MAGKPLFDDQSRDQIPRIDDSEEYDDEATVMREIPDDLLAEAAPNTPDNRVAPGGGSIFSNNAAPIRGALPTEEEGDALLDQLLGDAGGTPEPGSPAPAESAVSAADDERFPPIGNEESVDEPTRMLDALSSDEQVRMHLNLGGQAAASEAPEALEALEAPEAP